MSGVDRKLKPENYDAARARWAVVAWVVADHEGVSLSAVRFAGGGETRAGAALIRARRLSCYLAQVAAELSGHELANVSKLSRKTIREHVQTIEDARDAPALSAELDALTAEIQLVLARRAFAAARRQVEGRVLLETIKGPDGPLLVPGPMREVLDTFTDKLLAAYVRAEEARAAWLALLAQAQATGDAA